jgi:putative molybdopterin biosynthesis protein
VQDDPYLTTDRAAAYLQIKERKLYELVATGAIPCSKVTGKWLFPRAALDRWIEAGMARPDGFAPSPAPPIVGGSHDPLLEWALRACGSGLALLAEGSEAGLSRLARNEVAIAGIHVHDEIDGERANERAVAAISALHDAVVIGFVRREQGLMMPNGNPRGIGALADALAGGLRFGLRQKGAGAQLLLEILLRRAGADVAALAVAGSTYATGSDLALGVRSGEVDCGIASRAVAEAAGLAFLPVAWERFDLVMRRRTYFEPGPQALLAFMGTPGLARQARALGGYDAAEAGRVRLNR